MNSFSGIKGQGKAVRYLLNSIRAKRISNAYLFSGPDGVGKAYTVRVFIKRLFCLSPLSDGNDACGECIPCRKVEDHNHPDITWLGKDSSASVKIDEIRKIKEKLSYKPYESDRIVCVIENAHKMTQDASNALLKVLEEPPGNSVIMLITSKKELLLLTIRSRCTEVPFGPLNIDETLRILAEVSDMDKEEAKFLSYYSGGSPGMAISMKEDGIFTRRNEIISNIKDMGSDNDGSIFDVWDSADREGLVKDIDILISLARDAAVAGWAPDKNVKGIKYSAENVFEGYCAERLGQIVVDLIALRRALEGNVNPKLISSLLKGLIAGTRNVTVNI